MMTYGYYKISVSKKKVVYYTLVQEKNSLHTSNS
jgi:hypothetical protein